MLADLVDPGRGFGQVATGLLGLGPWAGILGLGLLGAGILGLEFLGDRSLRLRLLRAGSWPQAGSSTSSPSPERELDVKFNIAKNLPVSCPFHTWCDGKSCR